MRLTPIHESSAFQLFIFHIYILSFSFFVIIAHLEKVKSINECMCTANLLDYSEAMIRAVSDLPVPISCTFMYNDGSAGSIYKYYVLLFELLYYLQMH